MTEGAWDPGQVAGVIRSFMDLNYCFYLSVLVVRAHQRKGRA